MLLARLRKSVNGIAGILLIALLVFAFAIWGIGDTFTGTATGAIAKVGARTIDAEEYRVRLDRRLQEIIAELGGTITPQQAQMLGLDRAILNNMIAMQALGNVTDDLGLAVSDRAIAQAIIDDPAFHGPSGEFDDPSFRAILQNNGLTEKLFVKDQREFTIRAQLLGSLIDNHVLPEPIVSRLYRYYLERRIAEYVLIDTEAVDEVGTPTEDELRSFFAEARLRYSDAERRNAVILAVSPARFAETLDISESDLRDEYNASIDSFEIPEKRSIDQLVLVDEEVIARAGAMLAGDSSFAEIVQAAGQTLDNTDLGEITRNELISKDLADRAFSMQPGEMSDLIQGPLGSVILRVRAITPGSLTPFEEVSDQLREQIAFDQAIDDLNSFVDTVEDNRAAGARLEEIAKRYDLDILRINGIDRAGAVSDAATRTALQAFPNITDTIFASAVNEDLPFAETENGTYYWLRVDNIIPSITRDLEEIRDRVIADWQEKERRHMLESLATHLVERGNRGETMGAIRRAIRATVLRSGALNRGSENETFSREAVQKLFDTPHNDFAWARVGFGNSLIVMRVARIIPPAPEDREAQSRLFDGERDKYRADIAAQFIRSLEQNYGVQINERNLQRAATRYAQ